MKEMNEDLAPQRAKWYKRFLKDVSTTGFNVTGDMKRVIKKKDLNRRKTKVVARTRWFFKCIRALRPPDQYNI